MAQGSNSDTSFEADQPDQPVPETPERPVSPVSRIMHLRNYYGTEHLRYGALTQQFESCQLLEETTLKMKENIENLERLLERDAPDGYAHQHGGNPRTWTLADAVAQDYIREELEDHMGYLHSTLPETIEGFKNRATHLAGEIEIVARTLQRLRAEVEEIYEREKAAARERNGGQDPEIPWHENRLLEMDLESWTYDWGI